MSQQPQPSLAQKEARIQLAKNAIEQGQFQSKRLAARTYNASCRTLQQRHARIKSRHNIPANQRLLTDLEEEVLVQHILDLDLDLHGYPPSL